MKSRHGLYKSFIFAFDGLSLAFRKGRNFRIQIGIAILAVLLGLILKINPSEWLIIIILVACVLILELINTSLEAITDIVSPEISPKAKIAKDVAAAAVLIASIASVLAGTILFLPKILLML